MPPTYHDALEDDPFVDTAPEGPPPHMPEAPDTDPERPAPPPRPKGQAPAERRPRIPWGALALVLLYCLGAAGYIGVAYFLSADVAMGRKLARADRLLGDDKGRETPEAALLEAAGIYLDVLLVNPDVAYAYEKLETIHWRMQERDAVFPKELEMREAAVASRAKAGKAKTSVFDRMPVTFEERFGLGKARDRVVGQLRWAVFGLLLVVGWTGWRGRALRRQAEEAERAARERDRGSAMY